MTLEIDLMHAFPHWLEAHTLAPEGSADDSQASPPANVAAFGNAARRPAPRVSQFRQSASISAPTLAIEICGHSLLQRLMGTVVVIILNETRGALLLAPRRGRCRRSRFGLINPMHLLMSRVFLGSSAPRKLHSNSQAQPPCRQPRQIQGTIAGKGRTVVHADNIRLSKNPEQGLEILAHRFVPVPKQADAQQVAAEQIADRQRIHSLPIPGAKPAFEVHCPNLIWLLRDGQRPSGQPWSPSGNRTSGLYPSQTPQPFGDCSHLGQVGARMLSAQMGINLLCTPTRTVLPHLADLFEPALGSPSRRPVGTPRAIRQPRAAVRSKTGQPLETRLSTATKLPAEVSNRMDATTRRPNKALSRFQ